MAIDNTLDLSTLELREETYKINDFSREGSVVSKSAAIRHFHKLNPDIEIKQAGSFKINHQEQSVTLTVRVQPRHKPLNVSDCTAGIASPQINYPWDKVAPLNEEIARLRTKISELEIDQPSDLIAPLYEEITWLKTKISDLGTKNARLTRKNDALRETNEKLEAEIQHQKLAQGEVKAIYDLIDEDLKAAKARISELETMKIDLQDSGKIMTRGIDEKNDRIFELETKNAELEKALSDARFEEKGPENEKLEK